MLDSLQAETSRLLGLAVGRSGHDELFDFEESHSKAEGKPKVRRIKEPHYHSDAFRQLLCHPGLISLCRQLLMTEHLRRGDMKLNMKNAKHGSPVQWHQDWAFYPHTNDTILAAGVFLDDVTPDNGPLLMMPGTHCGPVFSYHHRDDGLFLGALDPDDTGLDLRKAVALSGRAGSVSFHHVRLVHGSPTVLWSFRAVG